MVSGHETTVSCGRGLGLGLSPARLACLEGGTVVVVPYLRAEGLEMGAAPQSGLSCLGALPAMEKRWTLLHCAFLRVNPVKGHGDMTCFRDECQCARSLP